MTVVKNEKFGPIDQTHGEGDSKPPKS